MKITELLGIQYPIIQGGMQYISRSPLVIAVSNAGGLGILTMGGLTTQELRQEIKQIREQTDKPFGVNINLMQSNVDELIQVLIDEKVPVVTTGAGSPKKYFNSLKAAGIIVIPVIASVKHAIKMEELGVDALIVEGQAAGGHIGSLSTMPLVRQVVSSVSLPVIAAGGIGDGQGLVAALALGAGAVQMGTIFLTSEECPIPNAFKQSIINASDMGTVVTGRKYNHPVRAINNPLLTEYLRLEWVEDATIEQLNKLTEGSLYRAVVDGDTVNGTMMAGEISGLIKEIQPVSVIINTIIKEAEETIQNLANF